MSTQTTTPIVGENVKVRCVETFNYTLDVKVTAILPNNEFEGFIEEIFDKIRHDQVTGGDILKVKGEKKKFKNTDIVR